MQDKFTKWVELECLKKANATAIARAIKDKIILRFSRPSNITSDNGRNFVGKEMTTLLEKYGISHRKTPPYSPQCNPVERANRVIKTMIAQYTGDNHKKWDKYIPEIAFAFNSARNESTGFSPAYLNFGRELSPPGSKWRKPGIKNTEGDRIKNLQDAIGLAQINKAMSFQKQQKYYNLRRQDWKPKLNDKVLKRSYVLSNKVENRNAKLSQKYDGPYTVHKIVSPVIFDLKRNGKITNHVHVKDLKPFQD
ncbi:hypothetical protein TKK_0019073 [Trichogramma kaykai]|uniref:Integrase catalytic domain-containing protein n=1 Tax=Trichogramma kaykai TaxID=54128 RepID=A0ABD2VVU1_9HYME